MDRVKREDLIALYVAIDEATQCHLCGEYDRTHLLLCPTQKERLMSQYRVVFNTNPAGVTDSGPNSVEFVEAPGMAEAMAAVMLKHENCSIIAAKLEGPALTLEEQKAELLRALRPLYTVCRALLDNPSAAPLFTQEMRKALEGMCTDAVAAMKAAGVER
jgi:hypothetical protein